MKKIFKVLLDGIKMDKRNLFKELNLALQDIEIDKRVEVYKRNKSITVPFSQGLAELRKKIDK